MIQVSVPRRGNPISLAAPTIGTGESLCIPLMKSCFLGRCESLRGHIARGANTFQGAVMDNGPVSLKVGEAVLKAAEYLRGRGVDSPRLDAELLMAHALGYDRLKVYLQWDMVLSPEETERMRGVLRRRGADREPIARILGQCEFFGRPFRVARGAFVPRPETEWLIERVLQDFRGGNGMNASDSPGEFQAIDIGTGSGCLAITLALECPQAAVHATDISDDALRIARENAAALGVGGRVRFHRGDLFAGLDGPFDLVLSNPPYVATEAIAGLMPEVVLHDPHTALDGGEGGLQIVERLIAETTARTRPGAMLLLEIGEGQGAEVARRLQEAGGFSAIQVHRDLAGLERYVEARRA